MFIKRLEPTFAIIIINFVKPQEQGTMFIKSLEPTFAIYNH